MVRSHRDSEPTVSSAFAGIVRSRRAISRVRMRSHSAASAYEHVVADGREAEALAGDGVELGL
jgi:hypothetical protein